MARGETEALRTLVEAAVLFLVSLSPTGEAGITVLRMRWGKDWVGLVKKGLPSVSSLLGFLGTQISDLFLVRGGNGRRGDR